MKKYLTMTRDNSTPTERQMLLAINSKLVKKKWPEAFGDSPPHCMCKNCGFVSDQGHRFGVDHVWPCKLGETSNRWVSSLRLYEAIQAGDTRALYQHGINAQVLCRGCNRSKGKQQFARRSQKAYAIQYSQIDRNPDHMYSGPLELSEF
jgi:hypothetical protein